MKKAEMEYHAAEYHSLMDQAHTAEREGLCRKAVKLALASWKHIDGMMRFERKYSDKEFDSVPAIELILKYSPLLFDFESLDALENLLKDRRLIERNTSDHLGDKLAVARVRMWENHRLWNHLERTPGTVQAELRSKLGGNQDHWREVVESWESMGLLSRVSDSGSHQLELTTRLGQIIRTKCPSCGGVADGPKAMFLAEENCPHCKTRVLFVLIPSSDQTNTKE